MTANTVKMLENYATFYQHCWLVFGKALFSISFEMQIYFTYIYFSQIRHFLWKLVLRDRESILHIESVSRHSCTIIYFGRKGSVLDYDSFYLSLFINYFSFVHMVKYQQCFCDTLKWFLWLWEPKKDGVEHFASYYVLPLFHLKIWKFKAGYNVDITIQLFE